MGKLAEKEWGEKRKKKNKKRKNEKESFHDPFHAHFSRVSKRETSIGHVWSAPSAGVYRANEEWIVARGWYIVGLEKWPCHQGNREKAETQFTLWLTTNRLHRRRLVTNAFVTRCSWCVSAIVARAPHFRSMLEFEARVDQSIFLFHIFIDCGLTV